jgi:hypothetical protein
VPIRDWLVSDLDNNRKRMTKTSELRIQQITLNLQHYCLISPISGFVETGCKMPRKSTFQAKRCRYPDVSYVSELSRTQRSFNKEFKNGKFK